MKKQVLSPDNVSFTGRLFSDPERLWMTQSGSGFSFIFKGKKLDIVLGCDDLSCKERLFCNKPRIAVKVNGRFRIKKRIDTHSQNFSLVSSDTVSEAEISVIKLSEAAFSLAYAEIETDDEAVISPVPYRPKRIGFIGDSITCAYGVDDSNTQSEFATEAENALKSYACIAADILGTEYALYAYSGYGIISGWTADGKRNTREVLPPYYEKLCHSYKTADDTDLNEIDMDHSSLPADIIVVNLGTNDNSFCTANPEAFSEFEEAYYSFLRTVSRCHPEAYIIAAIGIIQVSEELIGCIHRAVERYRETDSRISQFLFTPQNGDLGYGSNWHPSEDTHVFAAEELAAFIKENKLL